ncbi:discoidin domain-containing protein [bacterium]|nr:discoidin domain-containing protein [bacterium]
MLKDLCVLDSQGRTSTRLLAWVAAPREDFLRGQKMGLRLAAMTQTGANQVDVVLSTIQQETKAETVEAFKLTYAFDETEIRIQVHAAPGIHMGFEIGRAAQVAESLENGKEMALPPLPGVRVGVLQSVRITYADATELLFRWTGPGNSINVNENGGIEEQPRRSGSSRWGMRGTARNAEYELTYRIVRPKRPRRVLAAPQFTIEPPAPGAIFFPGERVRLDVRFDPRDVRRILDLLGKDRLVDARVEYTVTDQHGAEVGKGDLPIDFTKDSAGHPEGAIVKTVALEPGKLGCFDAAFRVVDGRKVLRPVWKERPFSVVEAIASPEDERKPMLDGGWDGYERNAFIGFGLVRENVDMKIAPEKGTLAWKGRGWDYGKRFEEVRALREATGVNAHFMLFHGSGLPWAKTPKDTYEVYRAIVDRYKGYNKNWETLNEPNIIFKPKEYLELYLKPLKLAAEKADPQANVIGFSMCGFGLGFIEEVYKLGGKDYFDAISIHPYIGVPYDIRFVEEMTKLKRLMARYGDGGKPVWLTEGGFGWFDRLSQTHCARHNVRRILIQDQFGIPKERDFYYFTTAMGYHRFYVMEGDGTLLPQAVAMRAMRVRLDGATYDRHFGFGVCFAHCNVYKGAGRQVAAVWTYDNTRTLTVKTDAKRVEGFDLWGNRLALEVKDGRIAVPASGEPTYLVLAPDASLEPLGESPGRNVADLAFGAEASASSAASPASLVMDGIWSGGGWRDDTRDEFPDRLEIELPVPARVDRCHIYTGGGSRGGDIRDADLVGMVDGKPVRLAAIRDNTDCILDVAFKPTTLRTLRLDVLKGNGGSHVAVHEVELFASGQAGGERGLTNWALRSNGAAATASSVWSLETETPEMDPERRGPNWAVSERRVKAIVTYGPEQAIDGSFSPADWREYMRTVWIDGTPGQFPDWLQIDFAGEKTLTAVLVFVNNFRVWRAAETGISDCELQLWRNGQWQAAGKVTGNRKGVMSFVLEKPTKTPKIRLVVGGSNDGQHAAIMEVQALGPKEGE